MKIALISCSKSKQSYECEAYKLYIPSELFRCSYEYAKTFADKTVCSPLESKLLI